MIIDDGTGRRKGILIDLDYAKDLDEAREAALLGEVNVDVPILPERPMSKGKSRYPSLRPAAVSTQDSLIREHNLKEFQDRLKTRGVRTVSVIFFIVIN